MSVTVRLLSSDEAATFWPSLAPMLDRAIARANGRMVLEDILSGIVGNRFGAWVASNDDDRLLGCVIANRLAYPRRKALNLLFIAGHNRNSWQEPMIAALEQFARDDGIDLIEGLGRKGFARAFPDYRVSAIAYEKDLTP